MKIPVTTEEVLWLSAKKIRIICEKKYTKSNLKGST